MNDKLKHDIFCVSSEGSLDDFLKIYKSEDANKIKDGSKISLLQLIVLNWKNSKDRIEMLKKVIMDGADVNYIFKKDYNRNALHLLYMNFRDNDYEVIYELTKILIEAGIDLNEKDDFDNIPLKYAICVLKSTTQELKPLYLLLIENGSGYNNIDVFGKSCLDYAKEYSWRNEFLDIIEESENDK